MRKTEIAKRYGLFIVSLFFAALGVAFTKHGELGVSPISSVANILSYKFDSLSLGTWLIIYNCVLIVGQIVILRKEFRTIQLLQVPLSFLFGWFTDFGMWIVSFIPVNSYPLRLTMVLVGGVILGFGITLSVIANVIMNAGEAFVKAVSDKIRKEFGNVKIVFDILNVVLALALSLVFFNFTIVGTREGTIISALLTGVVVKFFSKKLKAPLERILAGKNDLS
ncbi:MAG: YitT family protein [Lachnospiraceae bacterium]|nr:YitT family protein [Lachnospiraceae bacterium]